MMLPANKTKIICTIGPASEDLEVLRQMIQTGMNIARLNFSHGDFDSHEKVIRNLREAAEATGKRLAIMADLPGPKIRIGELAQEPIELEKGDTFILTAQNILGDKTRVSVSFDRLPRVVKTGDTLFINDGLIQIQVVAVNGEDVQCQVKIGGELRSRKGVNFPGIDLGISAFTDHDRECLKFAMDQGLDAVSQSFVENSADIEAVREAATDMGRNPFIIAKIERAGALDHIDSILKAADGIMIARGDLGVEVPIERIAIIQKQLMSQANSYEKPVITATHMLESMTYNRRPTRAEATDVANAILDGTDCVMLSGESAVGKFPVQAVAMLVKIAESVEPHRPHYRLKENSQSSAGDSAPTPTDLISLSVHAALERTSPAALIVPTHSGATARKIAHFRHPVWITAVSSIPATCQELQFSYGVFPVYMAEHQEDWNAFADQWVRSHGLDGSLAILTEGPSRKHPEANNRLEFIDLQKVSNG